MKKGLLSILAGALLVVGCQNYDDQFDSLESQISALASTVAGLSQVQSDLASLAGTVSSLASTVNGLGSTIDIAVADGLADIQADIDAINAAVADVASSEEVAALSDAVAASQTDLDELLANSSVFSGDVTINSVATLNAFHAMGSSLAIVNGNVSFTVTPDMDIAKVQEVADQMLTITKDLSYTSNDSSIAEVKFNNLSGVQSLTATQAGGYTFPELVSATLVVLGTTYDSKVTMVDFRKLATVTSIKTGTNDHAVVFDKATEIHLTSLKRYGSTTLANPLTLEGDEGGVIDITALDDVDTDGDQSDLHIKITGPKSMTITKITDGSINLVDVATASITGHAGTINIDSGVETLTVVDGVKVDLAGASDLEVATIDLKLDDDADLTTATKAYEGEDINVTGLTNLESLTVTGDLDDLTIDGNDNLVTLVVKANMDDLKIDDSDDLTSVTVTGSKIHDIEVTENGDLESLTLDHTTILTTDAKTAATAASLIVDNNDKLASLTYSADTVDNLTITDNDKLATVNFTGLKVIGSTTANVNITDNNFTATLAKDTKEATATAADAGAYTSTSGLSTLKTYLIAAAKAPGTSGVIAFFDIIDASEIQSTVGGDYTESTTVTVDQTSATNIAAIVYVTQKADDTAAKPQTESWYIPVNSSVANGSVSRMTNANYVAGGTGEGISIEYPVSETKRFVYSSTVADGTDTLDNFISKFNTEADVEGFDLTISKTGGYEHTFLITYVNTNGTNGVVSTITGSTSITFDFGTVTGLTAGPLSNGDTALEMAGDIATAINAAGNATSASFTATSGGVNGYAWIAVAANEDATNADKTPLRKWSIPTSLTISKTAAGSPRWSTTATNGETSYTLSVGAGVARYEGFIVTAKNNTAGTNRTVTVQSGAESTVTGGVNTFGGVAQGFWGVESKLSTSSFWNEGNIDGKSTTTVVSEIGSLVRGYADASAFAAGAAGKDTDRTGWL